MTDRRRPSDERAEEARVRLYALAGLTLAALVAELALAFADADGRGAVLPRVDGALVVLIPATLDALRAVRAAQ